MTRLLNKKWYSNKAIERIAYLTSNSDMKNLILLHGAMGCNLQMQDLADRLRHHFNIFLFEFEGHGKKSNSEVPLSIPSMASELDIYSKGLKLKKSFVFGYSMGGYVALYHAINNPNAFEMIMTLATKFDWNPESAGSAAKQLDPQKIEEKVPSFAKLLETRHGTQWKSLAARTAAMMMDLARQPELTDIRLAQITTPCILCRGDQDQMVTRAETHWAAGHIKYSETHLLENTTHPLEKVNLDQLAQLIISNFKN